VLVIAGLDPSGAAGLLADVAAVAATGARAWAVATAITAQGQGGGRGYQAATPEFLLAQLGAVLGGRERPRAVKTGMLATAVLARVLSDLLAERPVARLPLVVDPVLLTSSGLPLLDTGGLSPGEALAPLLGRARLATPNLDELARLTGSDTSTDEAAIRAARRLPSRAVLVKGGHRAGAPVDLLVEGRRLTRLPGRRRPGTARGTGCRLASAIAGHLARGKGLEDAVRQAKRFIERYLDEQATTH